MLELDIQMFADGKIVINTELDTKNFERGLNTMQSKAKSGGSTIKSIVAGLGITKLIGTAFNTINASMDTAIKRLDTMNNFPKVMSNLGISTQEADKSIAKMSDKLLGLPTTLDAGAMAVQRFTSKNSDVAKSTDLFLALNNAILAGGAPAEIQASALEQLSQAYAKGKPDMMEWRTAMSAMPAQLKQVAIAMGYVDADQLGEALRKGEVSMDQFMDTIMELNEKGIEGFQNFEQQARNSTGGIQTAMTNMKSRIAGGIADVIDALNSRFEDTSFGTLADLIAGTGSKVKGALDEIAKLIKGEISAQDFGENVGDLINKTLGAITQNLPKILDAGIKMILEFVKGFASKIPETIKKWFELIMALSNTIIDNLDLFIDAALEIILALVDGITDNLDKIIDAGIMLTMKLINKLTDKDTMDKLAQAAGKIVVALVFALIKAAPKILEAAYIISQKLLQELAKLPGKMLDVGKNIVKGIWEGIKARADKLARDLQNWASGLADRVKKALKIHSPSQVFRDEVGKMMAEGIGVGFKEGIDDVYKDMQKAIDLETDKMSANVQTSGTYKMAMANVPTFNLVDNATNQTQLVVNGKVLAEVVNTENRNREVAKA